MVVEEDMVALPMEAAGDPLAVPTAAEGELLF